MPAAGTKSLDDRLFRRIRLLAFILALVPALNLAATGIFSSLGANPIEKITRTTGFWTLSLLLLTLTATPLRLILHWSWIIRLRRMLGLFAFFYGSLHFLTYLVLDQFFDWAGILKDIVKRPYITVGFSSFLLMIPLAATSTGRMIRRLGGMRWRLLHRLVYLIAIGGVVHYAWLVKKDMTNPAIFAGLLTVLLVIRIAYWMRRLSPEKPGFCREKSAG